MRPAAPSLPFGLAFAGLAACDAAAPPDYRGEPLATIEARVVGDGREQIAAADDAALLFEPLDVLHFGRLEPGFANRFRLEIYEPPAPDGFYWYVTRSGVRYSYARVALLDQTGELLGVGSPQLVYFEGDLTGPDVEDFYGEPVAAGYHLEQTIWRPATDEERRTCADGLAAAGIPYDPLLCDRSCEFRLTDFDTDVLVHVGEGFTEGCI